MSLPVSVGLPVYNGQRYLAASVESLLGQTFSDFELIISDNASTDGTEDMCRRYAAQDRRIRYHRNDRNMGASWNFNRVFELSRGKYFKWQAHDDVCAPDFLIQCVEVLDRDKSVVLCYPREAGIDENGTIIGSRPFRMDTTLARPHERFFAVMDPDRGSPPIFGLIRRDILQRTPRIGYYVASDLVLLGELALYGRFHEVPQELLLHREHAKRSVYTCRTWRAMTLWYDPSQSDKVILPAWRVLREYCQSIGRAPLTWDSRARCYLKLTPWVRRHWRRLLADLPLAGRQVLRRLDPFARPLRPAAANKVEVPAAKSDRGKHFQSNNLL